MLLKKTKIQSRSSIYFIVLSLVLASCSTDTDSTDSNTYLMGGSIQSQSLNLNALVTTVAGVAGSVGSTDGLASQATFDAPRAITTDGTYLYVADSSNYTIRQINLSDGTVKTLAGFAGNPGSADGTQFAARFSGPSGITTDGTNLYVADTYNCSVRKIVIETGVVTTIAGSANTCGSVDGIGVNALLQQPYGITTDGNNLYITEEGGHTVRQIVIATGEVTTLAGQAYASGSSDGIGNAATFYYHTPGITNDGEHLYVTSCCTVRKINIATKEVTTLAGEATNTITRDGVGALARFAGAHGITTDGESLYIADRFTIRKLDLSNLMVTTVAGRAGAEGYADGTGGAAIFSRPYGITTNGIRLFLTDSYPNNLIRQIQ